jgi:hypothetical protein
MRKTSQDIEGHERVCFVSIPCAECVVGAAEHLSLPVKIVSMLACIVVVGGTVPPRRESRTGGTRGPKGSGWARIKTGVA